MTKICIQGAIVGSEIEKETDLDITAKEFIDRLDAVEGDVQVEITSPGGDVFSGIQIANAIARYNRGNISTHAVGLVASIASVILMAGRKVYVDENAFVMIHNPWTIVQGNAKDLEKEITQLNQCREAMMGFYRRHMLVTDDEMKALLDEETWFLGKDFADIMDVEVLACDEQIKIAARVMDKFKKLKDLMMEEEEKKTPEEERVEKIE